MPETKQITCSQCGHELHIPADLQEFSCLYCGNRMKQQPALSPSEGLQAAVYYKEHILSAVANHTNMERFISKRDFVPAFDDYSADVGKTIIQLDIAVSGGCLTLEEAVDAFLQQLEVRWEGKRSRQDSDKFTIAIFLVPLVRRMALSVSEDYCKLLCETWRSRYPKTPFEIGDYDTILSSFRKKYLGLCFITTAVCHYSGKADDCHELTAFRQFRDGYLRSCPDGPALIEEYYEIAPRIVARIDLSPDRQAQYEDLRARYLEPCYADLQAGNYEHCKQTYVTMVRELQNQYLNEQEPL